MRVPPLPADEWDEAVDHALSGMLPAERRNPADAGNLLATLVRHPKLTRAFLRFNNHLLFTLDAAAAAARAGRAAGRPPAATASTSGATTSAWARRPG